MTVRTRYKWCNMLWWGCIKCIWLDGTSSCCSKKCEGRGCPSPHRAQVLAPTFSCH